MYISKYFTNEEIDQRLLEGYYDDFVKAGFPGSKEEFFAFVLSIRQCVMKEEGKGLSTNDFTNEYKEKIDSTTTWSASIYRDPYEEGKVIFSVIPDRILIFANPWDLQELAYDPDLYSTINTVYQSIFILKPINNRDLYNPFPESSFISSGNKSLVKDQWNYVHIMWCVTEKPDPEDPSTWKGFVNIEILTDPVSKSELAWKVGTGLHSALLPDSGSRAYGAYSVAEGKGTVASGNYSHTEGLFTKTLNQGEHASGRYNVSRAKVSSGGGTLYSVGNGTSENGRFNIVEITFADAFFLYGVGGFDGVTIDESTESVQDIISVETLSNEEINNLIPELV